ncbi:MAG: hypothetical protein NZ455_16220 [Bacteroidia bacterium]|nr:hypothetical protein [Bacteroidia bacterium]
MGGWGAAPLARSTPTLWAYAQQNAHKDTPKKDTKSVLYKKNKPHKQYSCTFFLLIL